MLLVKHCETMLFLPAEGSVFADFEKIAPERVVRGKFGGFLGEINVARFNIGRFINSFILGQIPDFVRLQFHGK
jgi:hypothetical protein